MLEYIHWLSAQQQASNQPTPKQTASSQCAQIDTTRWGCCWFILEAVSCCTSGSMSRVLLTAGAACPSRLSQVGSPPFLRCCRLGLPAVQLGSDAHVDALHVARVRHRDCARRLVKAALLAVLTDGRRFRRAVSQNRLTSLAMGVAKPKATSAGQRAAKDRCQHTACRWRSRTPKSKGGC